MDVGATHSRGCAGTGALAAAWISDQFAYVPALDPGALAFAEDLPDAEVHLLDGGHFLLESALDEATGLIRAFLAEHHLAAS